MITIEANQMNGITLGFPIAQYDRNELKTKVDLYEVDMLSDEQNLSTLLMDEAKEFSLNGLIINQLTIDAFISENNPLIDGDKYLFTHHNLEFKYDAKRGLFIDILIYDESIEYLIEEPYKANSQVFKPKKAGKVHVPKELVFAPYDSLGDFKLGMSIEEFQVLYPVTVNQYNHKGTADLGNLGVRFDHGKLSQVQIASHVKQYKILLNGVNINSSEGLTRLLAEYPYSEDDTIYVFDDLGLTIWKDLLTLYVFDRGLLANWKDFDRPITSW